MASNSIIAPQVVLLGEALQPLLRKVEARLNEPARPVGAGESFVDFGQHALNRLGDGVGRLCDEANGVLKEIVGAADVPEAKVYRAAGRFEVVLDELLECYAELREARPHAAHARGHRLLVAVFRHALAQVRDWLRDVVDTAADPLEVVKRRGLPTHGEVTVTLSLDFTAPKELDEFNDWMAAEEERAEAEHRRRGVWSGVTALVAGIFLGGLFFGDDD